MKLKSFFLSFMLLTAVVSVRLQTPENTTTLEDAPRSDSSSKGYMLMPGDQIAGNVNGEVGYEFVSNVDENGMIYLPFVKKPIAAQCRTENELRGVIESELKKYLRDPQLNLRISEKRSRPPVSVYGEINKVSEIDLQFRGRATLIEMLARSGGPKDQEASGLVQIFRTRSPVCMVNADKDNWKAESNDAIAVPSRTYNLADIRSGRQDSNPTVFPGDVIVVHRAAPIWITGEVVAPQGVFLKERGLSLTEGLAMVGNPRAGAKTKDITIQRLKPGAAAERELISANLDLIRQGKQKDVMLQPYDIIVVDKAKDPIGLAILKTALNAGKTFAYSTANVIPARIVY